MRAAAAFEAADNMTDRRPFADAARRIISPTATRTADALAAFETRYRRRTRW